MLALLKSSTRRDTELLSKALFKFFLVQTVLSLFHVYKAFTNDESNLTSPFIAKFLAIFALIALVLGVVAVKTRNAQLLLVAVFYLAGHTLLGVISDYRVLVQGFRLPKSLLNIFTLALGFGMSLFQTYCAFLLYGRLSSKTTGTENKNK